MEGILRNRRSSLNAGFVLLVVMMAVLSSTFSYLGNRFSPGWDGQFLVVLGGLVAVEAVLNQPQRNKLMFPERDWILFHTTEWLVILIVVKLTVELRYGLGHFWMQMQTWDERFLSTFFNGEVFFSLSCIYFIWLISLQFANLLWMMRDHDRVLRMEEDGLMLQERWDARVRLRDLILYTGAGQAVIVALLRTGSFASWISIPRMRGGVFNALIYFGLGLILLSIGQLSSLKTRWNLNGIVTSRHVSDWWIFYSLIFLGLLAGIAFLLPTSYTIGLLGVLQFLLYLISGLITLFVSLVFLPVGWLLSSLAGLFGANLPESGYVFAPPQPIQMVDEIGGNFAISAYLHSLLFWVVMIGLVGYALIFYLKSRGDMLEKLRRYHWVSWLRGLLEQLMGSFNRVNISISKSLETSIARVRMLLGRDSGRDRFDYVNPKRLTPRAQMRFYFLALIRRGQERGVGRKGSQSPYEYAQSLYMQLMKNRGGEAENALEEDIVSLAEGFVVARYSIQEIDSSQVRTVERAWNRMRTLLKRLRPRKPS